MTHQRSVEDQLNEALDESIENLSPEIRRRLNQSRIKALEKPRNRLPIWQTAAGVSLVLVISLNWDRLEQQPDEVLTPFSEVLAEDLEMLDELEFAYWMAEENISATL